MSNSKPIPPKLLRRLQQDLDEINSTPNMPFAASPLEKDFLQWHVNIMGQPNTPYHNTLFHLEMIFPLTYPAHPPNVQLHTPVSRTHVYGSWICLDMLETHHSNELYHGWSSAYSAFSILLQLSSFLLMEEDPGLKREYKNAKNEVAGAMSFKCWGCSHNMKEGTPFPVNPEWNFDGLDLIRSHSNQEIVLSKLEWKRNDVQEKIRVLQQQKRDFTIPVKTVDGIPQLNSCWGRDYQESIELKKKQFFDDIERKEAALWKEYDDFKVIVDVEVAKLEEDSKVKQYELLLTVEKEKEHNRAYNSLLKQDKACRLTDVPDDCLMKIFSFLNRGHLLPLRKVCKDWKVAVMEFSHFLVMDETPKCFYSKVGMNEAVLGIGVTIRVNPINGSIAYIDSTLDFLSYESYSDDKVRTGVWRESFEFFLPVYLNKDHGSRAIKVFEECIVRITNSDKFEPLVALDVLCKLMNTQVVNVLKGNMWNSSKSLAGYSLFHRWLIYLVETYASVKRHVNNVISNFINDEYSRDKNHVEIIGEFLPLLSVSRFNWSDIDAWFLDEVFARNVRWCLKTNPELGYHCTRAHRFAISFESAKTMLQLIMYHVYFLKTLAKPEGIRLSDLANTLDQKNGMPSFLLQEKFQSVVFKIQSLSHWSGFFKFVEVKPPSEERLEEILLDSIAYSANSGYHHQGVKPVKSFDEIFTKQLIETNHVALLKQTAVKRDRMKTSQDYPWSTAPLAKQWSPWTTVKPFISKDVFKAVMIKRGDRYISVLKRNGREYEVNE